MNTLNIAVTFVLVTGVTSALDRVLPVLPERPETLPERIPGMPETLPERVGRETLCASFKMYAFDRPDTEFLNQKRRNGKIPMEDPDPSWVMTEIRGSEVDRSSKRTCGSTDTAEIVECCFVRGSPVELTVVEGRTSCVGLLGPMDPEMPVELLDRIASKMMACDRRRSLNPPISVFGRTIEKKWRNLTRKWRDRRTYKIESWGAEEETQDQNRCYDVVGLPAARGKQFSWKHADAMSWKMMRPDGSVLCGSNNYRKHGNTFRGRVTECCNIAGRETILRLEDDSWGKAGWGSGYIKFMDLKIHNKKKTDDEGNPLLRENETSGAETEKDIVFMWGDRKSFKEARRKAKNGLEQAVPLNMRRLNTVEEFCEMLVASHTETVCADSCAEIKAEYSELLPAGMLDVCEGTGMTIAGVCPEVC